MSFSTDWLAQREPFDHAARSHALVDRFVAALPRGPIHLAELGGGLGSGIRFVAPSIPEARFTLVDHDPVLLAAVDPDLAATLQHDLRDLASLDLAIDGVCCQALLDLVDVGFLTALADWAAKRRLPLLASLTVDGRVRWTPEDPDDAAVGSAFRLHQLGDRGFGASPGPHAWGILVDLLRVRGYTVEHGTADWQIPADANAMLRQMVDGTAEAAAAVHPDAVRVAAWRQRRHQAIDEGALSLVVGHVDLCGWPTG